MIINLTQHRATPDQLAAGVIDLDAGDSATLTTLLTFDSPPSREEIQQRASDIALLATVAFDDPPTAAMIGGAPYLMSALESALLDVGITPMYAFSVRVSTEEAQPDGTVRKVNTFRHGGWVRP